MNKCIVLLALLAVPAWAQEQRRPPTVDESIQRNPVYQFQFATDASTVVNFVQSLVQGSASLQYFPSMNSVIIRPFNPTSGDGDKIIALLKKYDVPKPAVDIKTYMVMSLPQGSSWSDGKPVPAELQSAMEQMKQTLGDRVYSLRDVIESHAVDSASVTSDVPGSSSATYELSFNNIRVSRETKTVHIGWFHFSIKPCPRENCQPLSIENQEVAIQEGQKLVFGKLPVLALIKDAQHTADLYLIVTAKIQDAPKQ